MKNLGLLFEVSLEEDLIGLFFCLAKDNGTSMSASVEVDNVCDHRVSVVEGTVEGQVFDGLRGSDI